MSEIKIKCRSASEINIDDLVPFQGELKELSDDRYKLLKNDIVSLGFSEPISVWVNDGQYFILNGHQRVKTLKRMRDQENFEIPLIPISIVEADSIKEAKTKVLAMASQYGEVTGQGLYEFLLDSEIDYSDIKDKIFFADLDLKDFEIDFLNINTDGVLNNEPVSGKEAIDIGLDDNYVVLVFKDENNFKKALVKFKLSREWEYLGTTKNVNMVYESTGRCVYGDDFINE